MKKYVWIAEVEIYNCRYDYQWDRFTFTVIAENLKLGIPKVEAAINRAGFRHRKRKIISIVRQNQID